MRLQRPYPLAFLLVFFLCVESFAQVTQTFNSNSTFVVPAGVTEITVKAWGAGGGGGAGGDDGPGGDGGGGGFAEATISVTPGESLNIAVGGGGGNGDFSDNSGDGGGGGGYSGVDRGGTFLIIAPGGGGGGGGDNSSDTSGGDGGAGGGTNGLGGTASSDANGGNGGTSGSGGSGGSGGENNGSAGSLGSGGAGGDGGGGGNGTGDANNGGTNNGGDGGDRASDYGAGGGGGAGYYGGGGGSSANGGDAGGGGGGGGSGFVTGSSTTLTAGSGTTPGNNGDSDRAGSGDGGSGGGTDSDGSDGDDGILLITYTLPPGAFAANGTYTVPTVAGAEIVSVIVEVYGAGGGGGYRDSGGGGGADGAGGGGGGGFRGGNIGVSEGDNIAVVVGTGGAGGPTTDDDGTDGGFSTATHASGAIRANGGSGGGGNNSSAGGSGGDGFFTGTVTNQIANDGGDGGDGDGNEGGGGGEAGGSDSAGEDGENYNPGSGNSNGGDGGFGGNDGAGSNGGNFGGGGGGAGDDGGGGGDGSGGFVYIYYELPDISDFNVALSNGCTGGGVSFEVTSASLTDDTYTITYNVTGTDNSISTTTTTMAFSAGTGSFVVGNLSAAENSDLHITKIAHSTGNSVDMSDDTNFDLVDCQVWYSYESGNFSNPYTWTLDPSGTTYDNGLLQTPGNGEEIVILNGFTVITNVNNKSLISTTIEAGAILDMESSTDNDLGVIGGEGLLRINGVGLPSGTYTDFVSTDGGTIEYYDTGGVLPTGQVEYNNLKMTASSGSATFVLTSDLTVNGDFSISSDLDAGNTTWQINDASDVQRTITLYGDLSVATNGSIAVGTGNEGSSSQHNLTSYGNFTNNGTVKFFDGTDDELEEADYSDTTTGTHTNELQGNAVTVTFSGTTNNTVNCNGTTDFYRFVLDKGSGQQAKLTLNSSNTANFRMFGPSNIGSNSGETDNEYSDNALSIINGTLELTGAINIPVLAVRNSDGVNFFSIPQEAALWINGANVVVNIANNDTSNGDQRMMLNGTLRVSAGTLNGGDSKGIGSQDGGAFIIEGGTINCWMFRPRAVGTGIFSFQQTGGTFNIGYGFGLGAGVDYSGYYRFDLPSPNSTFEMSGGTLNIAKPSPDGMFRVLSSIGNYIVTGGTVNLYTGVHTGTTSYEGLVNLTVPLYNLTINEESATNVLTELESNLVVLNDLTINSGNDPSLITNDFNLTLGGDFTINSGTTYTPGSGITTFDGNSNQSWINNGTITSLSSVVMDKSGGTLTLGGDDFPDITTALTLTSGTLDDGGKELTLTGTAILTNNATHSGSGVLAYSSSVGTINGSDGTFGNLTITTDATIATAGKHTITGDLRLTSANTKLDIGSHELVALGGIYSSGGTVTQTFTSGSGTFEVPAGITEINVKAWGAGGGGGAGGSSGNGGTGGNGGYAEATVTVTPGENLNVVVGTGGGGGNPVDDAGGGGGGGGHSEVNRSGTNLVVAAGGGGGGGGDNSGSGNGGAGGAGGGTTGSTGSTGGSDAVGGGGGTSGSGGAGGNGDETDGTSGGLESGGDGGTGTGGTGGELNGGTPGDGHGGVAVEFYGGGGGGGSGYYGGGGGSSAVGGDAGGGGGGGGSSYVDAGETLIAITTGFGSSGGAGGVDTGSSGSAGSSGDDGLITISYTTSGNAEDFDANKMILTNGLHNAGGLSRQGASGDLLFPVGTGSIYTPNTINVAASTHGIVSVRPVSNEHPIVTTTGESLEYYWRVTSEGYEDITSVAHKSYTFSTANKATSGSLLLYKSARYDPENYTWASNPVTFNATSATAIPDFNAGITWGLIGDQLDGEYTCGNSSAFGPVNVFYSRQSGNWNESTTWSNSSVGGAGDVPSGNTTPGTHFPGPNDPVVIGDADTNNHTITTVANSSCGSLGISLGSTLDCSTFTGHNFGTGAGGVVEGRGTLSIGSNVFPAGDFTNFIGADGGTVEWYGTTKTIPTTGPAPQSLSLANYYNLVINPTSGNTITLPASDLIIYNDWTQGSTTDGNVYTNGSRSIEVNGDLLINDGAFDLRNTTNLTVGGNSTVGSGASWVTNSGGSTLSTTGGITNDGTLDFSNGGVVDITFTGTENVSFSGTGSTSLSLVEVDKGSGQNRTVTFDVSGSVTTTPVASGWLTISNGTFDFANNGTYTLSTNSYSILPAAKLKVSSGTVNITSGDADSDDLFLGGTLDIVDGTVNVGNTTVNDNNVDIEYTSAGLPTINIGNGSLWVKSSVRRSTTTITGALVYNQTGGTATIAGISSTENDERGVFEIDSNEGSSFTLTGTGNLSILRQTGGSGYTDVFINPVTSNVSSTSTISLGLSSQANDNFRINISPTTGNLEVAGTSAQVVNMFSNELNVGGNLTIPAVSELNTNSLDVTIAGDFDGSGTYNGSANNTTFNGPATQTATLSGTSSFNDMTIDKSDDTRVNLLGSSPILQNLHVLSGILDVGSFDLEVNRNITINSVQEGDGSILINSTNELSNTITSSGGSFTNLTLGGSATNKTVTVKGNLGIEGKLDFDVANRFLMIKSKQLTFGENAEAIEGAGETAFIRTNGVASDLGVTKEWGVGSSSFVFEIGTFSNYTPASYTLDVSTAGSLNVIPVNSYHLTYNQASGEQILDYNWIVSRDDDLEVTSAAHTYAYPDDLISGSGGTLVAGYLDPEGDPLGWETSAHNGSATTTLMTFTDITSQTNFPPKGENYDYTVGTDTGSDETLPNPILPLYSRVSIADVADTDIGGSWIIANNWTFDSSGDPAGMSPSAFVPKGVPVVILEDTRINISDNLERGRRAYRTTINGILNVGTITGHNLGRLAGTGTMSLATNTIPAGNYTEFTASGGGTIEYATTMTMNSLDTYNNLTIQEGSGATVTMTASELTVNGSVTIPGGTTLENRTNNADITVEGLWENGGTYNAGEGTTTIKGQLDNSGTINIYGGTTVTKSLLNNTGVINGDDGNLRVEANWDNSGGTFNAEDGNVTFGGPNGQTTIGAITFNDLTMNKSLMTYAPTDAVTVNGALTMIQGNIISSNYPSAPMVLLGSDATTSGGSSSSFVGGQIQKVMNEDTDFTFPIGYHASSRYQPVAIENTSAADTWTVSYIGSDPTGGGYDKKSFDEEQFEKISQFEYWEVSRAGSAAADMTLSYSPGSYASGIGVGDLDKLSIVHWVGDKWVAASGDGTAQSGDEFNGSFTVRQQSSFSPQTFGSGDEDSGLPVTWLSFSGKREPAGVGLLWQTATEINNDYFDVERSEDGVAFEVLGARKGAGNTNSVQSYNFLDTKASAFTHYYYRIKQVDFDGQYSYSSTISVLPISSSKRWNIYPNPAEHGADLTLTELTSSTEHTEETRVQVVTSDGRLLLNATGTLEMLNGEMNKVINQNSEGMYFLQVIEGDIYQIFKVIRK
ncbi:MAG: T9SS type A sorting domain-containing protein [Cyclobacteriaceae bacterium]